MIALKSKKKNLEIKPLEILAAEVSKIIFGKELEVKLALTCLLARGHLLLEDIPGVGKTTLVICLSHLLGLKMSRIQFTNDLLPSDVLGANVFEPKTGKFQLHRGPIFSEIVLGDELNRASPKSQSAFLQAMEEQAVSIDGQSYALPEPFFVLATQNPQSQVGTNPLPESQLDRFLMRLTLGYPSAEAEQAILMGGNPREKIKSLDVIFDKAQLLEFQKQTDDVVVSKHLVKYVQLILSASRTHGAGLSPRAGLHWLQAAKAWALLSGRDMVLPEDAKAVAVPVLAHRLSSHEPNAVHKLIEEVPVP